MLPLSVSRTACLPPELFAPAGTSRPPDDELQAPRQTAARITTSERCSTAFISAFFQRPPPREKTSQPKPFDDFRRPFRQRALVSPLDERQINGTVSTKVPRPLDSARYRPKLVQDREAGVVLNLPWQEYRSASGLDSYIQFRPEDAPAWPLRRAQAGGLLCLQLLVVHS